MSFTISSLFIAGLVFEFAPSSFFGPLEAAGEAEIEIFRFAGLFLMGLALLLNRKQRKGVIDPSWGRITIVGDVAIVCGALYFLTGMPLWLLISFSLLVAITFRTLLSILDHWSREVRARLRRRA